MFVKGTDGGMWHRSSGGITWSNYEALGGLATSDPGAASWATSRVDLFTRGTDGQLWHRFGY